MNLLKRPIALLLFLTASLATAAVAQQKRPAPAKPQPSAPAPAAPTPPPTFETLLAADSYKIYGEVRSVGQFIRSNSVNEILEPILKLAGPPKEFRNVVKWLNLHAEEVMTSRMLVGFEPGRSGLPTMLVAIEFPSAEEATKFQLRLNEFLPKILPAPSKTIPTLTPVEKEPPPYFIQQAGSLILVTPTKADLKKLRPVGSKLLAEDVNFRVARNRFNSEAIFIYVDVPDEKSGEVVNWALEMGGPNTLLRLGWKRDSLKVDDLVSVEGSLARYTPHLANASSIVMVSTGKKMLAGSSKDQQ